MKNILRSTTAIVFVVSIVSGLVQFVGQSYLNSVLPTETFSQLTFVIAQFSTYMLLVELGIQGELVRQFSATSVNVESLFSSAMLFRLLGAVAAFGAILIHGLVANVSGETFIALALFGLCFFPAAILVTYEGLGFALRRPLIATALRFARTIALLVFLVLVPLFQQQALNLFVIFAIIFFVFTIFLFAKGPISFQKLSRLHKNDLHNAFQLASDMKTLVLYFVLGWVITTLFSVISVRTLGDVNLSEFNVAQILAIPIALYIQVVSQNWIADSSKKHDGQIQFSGKHIVMMFVGTIFYQVVISQHFFLHLLFPKINAAHVVGYFIPFGLTQCVIGINGFSLLMLKTNGRGYIGLYASLVGIALMVLSWPVLSSLFGSQSLGFLYLLSYSSLGLVLGLSVFRLKQRQSTRI